MKHLVFVVNPRSGTDRAKAIDSAVAKTLDLSQYTYEIRKTSKPKHGTGIAREAAQAGAFAVIAVGGDGSVNDVATGLLGTGTALGIVPKGSGNGFARTLGIPLKLKQAIERLNQGRMARVDVCFANGQLFLSNSGVAFDAVVTDVFAESKRRGLATYSLIIMRRLFTYKPRVWTLEVDGRPLEVQAFMAVVANGRQFGYNFQIAPEADYTDGLMNLVIVKKFPHWAGGLIALDSLLGRLTKNRFVTTCTASSIRMAHPDLKLFQTDGDPHTCQGSVQYRIEKQALNVLY